MLSQSSNTVRKWQSFCKYLGSLKNQNISTPQNSYVRGQDQPGKSKQDAVAKAECGASCQVDNKAHLQLCYSPCARHRLCSELRLESVHLLLGLFCLSLVRLHDAVVALMDGKGRRSDVLLSLQRGLVSLDEEWHAGREHVCKLMRNGIENVSMHRSWRSRSVRMHITEYLGL